MSYEYADPQVSSMIGLADSLNRTNEKFVDASVDFLSSTYFGREKKYSKMISSALDHVESFVSLASEIVETEPSDVTTYNLIELHMTSASIERRDKINGWLGKTVLKEDIVIDLAEKDDLDLYEFPFEDRSEVMPLARKAFGELITGQINDISNEGYRSKFFSASRLAEASWGDAYEEIKKNPVKVGGLALAAGAIGVFGALYDKFR